MTTVKKQGRPKWTPTEQDIAKAEELVAMGHTMENVGLLLNKNRDTLFERIKDTPEFSDAIKRGRSGADNLVLSEYWKKIKAGETACILFYMKTRMGWKETQVVENTGKDGGPIKTEVSLAADEIRSAIKGMVDNKESKS